MGAVFELAEVARNDCLDPPDLGGGRGGAWLSLMTRLSSTTLFEGDLNVTFLTPSTLGNRPRVLSSIISTGDSGVSMMD